MELQGCAAVGPLCEPELRPSHQTRPDADTNTHAVPQPQDNQIRAAQSIVLGEEAALASLPTHPYPALGSQRSSTNQAYHNMVDTFGGGVEHLCVCVYSIYLIGHTPSLVP